MQLVTLTTISCSRTRSEQFIHNYNEQREITMWQLEDVDTPSQMYIQAFKQICSPLYTWMMIIHCCWLHTHTHTQAQCVRAQWVRPAAEAGADLQCVCRFILISTLLLTG